MVRLTLAILLAAALVALGQAPEAAPVVASGPELVQVGEPDRSQWRVPDATSTTARRRELLGLPDCGGDWATFTSEITHLENQVPGTVHSRCVFSSCEYGVGWGASIPTALTRPDISFQPPSSPGFQCLRPDSHPSQRDRLIQNHI